MSLVRKMFGLLHISLRRCVGGGIRRMSSCEDPVLFDVISGKGSIVLNRPKALNSLNVDMVRLMHARLREWKTDPDSIKAVIVESSHPKAFCAGGDVVDVTVKHKGSPDQSVFFNEEYALDYDIGTLNIPWISIMNGITMGGGVGISIHGKYRIATEKTLLAMPELSIGLFPDVGGSWFLPRLKGCLGFYIGLTGYVLKGSDTYHSGLATHMCSSEDLSSLKKDLFAAETGDFDSVLLSYHEKFPIKPFTLSDSTLKKINEIFANFDNALDMMQNIKCSDDDFAREMYRNLVAKSPTSLALSYRQLKEGEKLETLKECFEMEYRMCLESLKRPDFYEGVRALLVDKDKSPKWNPCTLEEVSNLEAFFKKSEVELKL